jgi:hypothetical protein
MQPRIQSLSDSQLQAMQNGARILEQDERGIKVMELENGDMLKVFRVRNRLSVAHLYSYARRFCRNAFRLDKLGIPTVKVKALYRLEAPSEKAVLYSPLPGITIRDLLRQRSLTVKEAEMMGEFLAKLHRSGVHFRSLHLGNIVLDNDGRLGLIDIADMRIYPWPLWCSTRQRSFKHFHRYPEQISALGEPIWQGIESAYFTCAALSQTCEDRLRRYLRKISVFSG